jgi:hypothetical protein
MGERLPELTPFSLTVSSAADTFGFYLSPWPRRTNGVLRRAKAWW